MDSLYQLYYMIFFESFHVINMENVGTNVLWFLDVVLCDWNSPHCSVPFFCVIEMEYVNIKYAYIDITLF